MRPNKYNKLFLLPILLFLQEEEESCVFCSIYVRQSSEHSPPHPPEYNVYCTYVHVHDHYRPHMDLTLCCTEFFLQNLH